MKKQGCLEFHDLFALQIKLERFLKKSTCQIYRQNFQLQNIVTNDKKPFCKGHVLTAR